MKKILIFLIVTGALSFIFNLESKAYTFNGESNPSSISLHTDLIELNNYSLYDIFMGTKFEFTNFTNSSLLYSDNETRSIIIGSSSNFTVRGSTPVIIPTGENFYISVGIDDDIYREYRFRDIQGNMYYPSDRYLTYGQLSGIFTPATSDISVIGVYSNNNINPNEVITFTRLTIVNLNDYGLQSINVDLLDYYFNIYTLLVSGLSPGSIYSNGYTNGEIIGYSDGYNDGYSDGLNDGYNNGYSDGQEDGYDTGYLDGNVAGLETGYLNGYNDGYSDGVLEEVDTQYLLGFVSGAVDILGVSIIPGITLGVFVFIPLFLGFIGFIFRLGGRRG